MIVNLYLNIFSLIIDPSVEGFVIVSVLVTLFLIGFLYIKFIDGPREENEKNEWIKNNEEKLLSQTIIYHVLTEVGKSLPSCEKCNSTEFQLWELLNDKTVIRCVQCKKKSSTSIEIKKSGENESNYFHSILSNYIDLVQFTMEQGNNKLGNYLRDYLIWDFFSQRKGTLIFRVITFHTNPSISNEKSDYSNIKNDEPSRRISQKVMDRVWNRDGGKCVQCGSNEKLEFDHIIPFSKGGSNTYRNIQLLCEKCNRSKSNNIG